MGEQAPKGLLREGALGLCTLFGRAMVETMADGLAGNQLNKMRLPRCNELWPSSETRNLAAVGFELGANGGASM
jgi:hypothetical protein